MGRVGRSDWKPSRSADKVAFSKKVPVVCPDASVIGSAVIPEGRPESLTGIEPLYELPVAITVTGTF